MTRATHRALQAASPRHNMLALDGRRKPKPLPLLDAVPEPIERPAITRTRRTIEKRLTAYEKAFAKARRFKPHDGSAAASVAKHDVQVAMTKLLKAEMRHEKARAE